MKKTKNIHILIIVIGIIFISISSLHQTIWFDESYSVSIAKHSFTEIWKITGNDVHPALYYWFLHIIYMIFGNNIIAFRLFSVLGIAVLGILGFTYIRKDFGEKTGILFSFLTFFLPIMCTYATEIRMYSWSAVFVTLMAIYAYRFYKDVKENEKFNKKNLCLFGIFSICSCYIHYYALVTAGLINLLLLIFVIKEVKKTSKPLKAFFMVALVQIVLYIPWLIYLITQMQHVGGGFWIKVGLVNTTVEVLSFQFRRMLDDSFSFNIATVIPLIISVILYLYIGIKIYKDIKEKKNIKPAIYAIAIYLGVIAIILIISIVMPILYSRYLLVITGIYIFAISYILATEKNKVLIYSICIVIALMSIWGNIENIKTNYDSSNMQAINYIKDQIEDDDIIIYSNFANGGVIAAYFPEYKQYYLNLEKWDIEEAYKAYAPGMQIVRDYDFLNEFSGKIWVIDTDSKDVCKKLEQYDIKILKEIKRFNAKYHNYTYNIMLIEKK